MIVMMMVVVVPVSWRDHSDVHAGAMVVMVVSDHNLGRSDAATLRQPFIVGF